MWSWSTRILARTNTHQRAAKTTANAFSRHLTALACPSRWLMHTKGLPAAAAPPPQPHAAAAKRRLSPTTAVREFSQTNKKQRDTTAPKQSASLHTQPVAAASASSLSAAAFSTSCPESAPASASSAVPTASSATSPSPSLAPAPASAPFWTIPPSDIDMASAPLSQAQPVLQLTDLERAIFTHVLGCCAMFKLDTQVRVAGGWVRDKLLGLSSEDIDFALDNMSGEDFATKLAEYLTTQGLKASGIGVIKSNPDQSKHLATATMKVLDMSIDINNFRSEIYEPNSRIPTIALSTAEEDAMRRDFTVNGMFYNIHTQQVEDHVGGLPDLRAGLLRTPRDPSKTFSDDPLRILRAARFAGRFGYRVDELISAAAQQPAIKADLASKVSRERMGIEVHKCVQTYKAAFISFRLLCKDWGLRRIIFEMPAAFEPLPVAERGSLALFPVEAKNAAQEDAALTDQCLLGMHLAHEEILRSDADAYAYSQDEASTLLFAAFLAPYHGYRVELKKLKFNSLVWHIIRESLKLTQRDAQLVSDLLGQAHQLIRASYLHELATTQGDRAAAAASSSSAAAAPSAASAVPLLDRLQLVTGGLLRQTGSYSVVAMRLAHILIQSSEAARTQTLSAACIFDRSLGWPEAFGGEGYTSSSAAETRLQRYCQWIAKESKLLQLPVWEMKPLASGTDVCVALGISAKGPHVGQVINKMMDWQMMHLEQMLPLYAHTTAAAAASSSAAAAASTAAAATQAASSSSAAAASPSAALSAHPVSASSSSSAPSGHPSSDAVRTACFAWLSQFKDSFVADGKPARAK